VNRLALFDCDGTLVDSQANICRAMESCFVAAKLDPPDRAATRNIVGLSLVEAMRALVPDAENALHVALAEGYKAEFRALRSDGLVDEPLFDGIAEVIAALDDAGWVLGVATGKSDRGLAFCLEQHGIAHRFVTLQTADRHPSKPHPSMVETAMAEAGAAPGTTIVIGDTSYDMMMARTANAGALGVSWGYHAPDALAAAGAHRIAARPAELPELLDALS
jgi:phosphoglycolate phosphatase